ncbi:response regulator [Arthrospiribacter ruber]|uniref:Response regulator n=1 Tax=Arthrospiribacter ruber TaxID=2487934 RepID=A0A951IWJ3_9BACT|nr:response regulator [Arthrospiribacter ruber]MBW3466838.1 response regulator [Arthrospiribacter ruber]
MEKRIREVILIDDDHVLNKVNTWIFRKLGFSHEITSLGNGDEALLYVSEIYNSIKISTKQEKHILILLDLNMPIMTGWEFIEKFKSFDESFKNLFKIIILTSSYNPDDIELSNQYEEIVGFENKPLSLEGLKVIMERYF